MSNANLSRNRKIYEEYLNSSASLYNIAKKYNISRQRVQQIIHQECFNHLSIDNSQKDREKAKDEAVLLREKGSLHLAEDIFKKVLEWDKAHNNYRGYADVVGHLRIVYVLLSRRAKDNHIKKRYLQKAKDSLESVLKDKRLSKDSLAILEAHYVGVFTSLAELTRKKEEREKLYLKAEKILRKALKNFPGSIAHKAWPLGRLAFIQYNLKKYDEAFSTAHLAEECIYKGYLEEFKNPSGESLAKFSAWLPKNLLIKALVCKETNRDLLANYYARSVLKLSGPAYQLKAVRREARKILSN